MGFGVDSKPAGAPPSREVLSRNGQRNLAEIYASVMDGEGLKEPKAQVKTGIIRILPDLLEK